MQAPSFDQSPRPRQLPSLPPSLSPCRPPPWKRGCSSRVCSQSHSLPAPWSNCRNRPAPLAQGVALLQAVLMQRIEAVAFAHVLVFESHGEARPSQRIRMRCQPSQVCMRRVGLRPLARQLAFMYYKHSDDLTVLSMNGAVCISITQLQLQKLACLGVQPHHSVQPHLSSSESGQKAQKLQDGVLRHRRQQPEAVSL